MLRGSYATRPVHQDYGCCGEILATLDSPDLREPSGDF
jgi:hypothetical protein